MIQHLNRLALLGMLLYCSCRSHTESLVDGKYTDSLVTHYRPTTAENTAAAELVFWKSRLDASPGSFTPGSRLAGALVQRFHLYGNINDLLEADSLLSALSTASNGKEAGVLRSMATLNITRHRFRAADSLVRGALAIGSERYASTLLLFDTEFELGAATVAGQVLSSCAASNEYGYFFRLSKWKHMLGETDSAVFYLEKALQWSGTSTTLKQAALSNMGDLYFHEGKMEKAASLYRQSLAVDASDWRSLQGLGRIALVHDNRPDIAERIFRFIEQRNKLPDALYNLAWLAEQRRDSTKAMNSALRFAAAAEQPAYGGMYNKYLVECYTGILNAPEKALQIAAGELDNRSTPQTNAWYAWSLHRAGKDAKALDIYRAKVSGKPLEALELYWMGKMMQEMNKPYNAAEFFRAADRNRSDLSPAKQRDLQVQLK